MTFRKTLLVLGAVGLLSIGLSAPAMAGGSVFAGVSMPTGDFADAAKMSYQFGASYGIPVAPMVNIGAMAAYNRFSWEEGVEGNFNSIELLAFGRFSAPVGPFGMVGLGMSNYAVNIEIAGLSIPSDRESDFTWAIGGGYKFTMVEFTGLYHNISTEGGSTNYFTLTAGLGF
jgi:hypothetical protein